MRTMTLTKSDDPHQPLSVLLKLRLFHTITSDKAGSQSDTAQIQHHLFHNITHVHQISF